MNISMTQHEVLAVASTLRATADRLGSRKLQSAGVVTHINSLYSLADRLLVAVKAATS